MKKYFSPFLFLLFLLNGINKSTFANVSVSGAIAGTNICANKSLAGSTPTCTQLGTITITEGSISDLATGTDVLVLHAPTGWQFCSGLMLTTTFTAGRNITSVSILGTTDSTITLNIAVSGINKSDKFTISGIKVEAFTNATAPGYVYASSVIGIAGIAINTTNFANLSLTPVLNPSVTITATPGDTVCPGTPVLFTPIPVNSGSPTYQWYINGVLTATGPTYSNSSLQNNNAIYCNMIPTGCVSTATIKSDTITMNITGPGLINGGTNLCPGSVTTLTDTTPSGSWSSSNSSVATIDPVTGSVTAVGVGVTTISYYLGSGCPAIVNLNVTTPPTPPVVTLSSTGICNGNSVMITGGTFLTANILTQDFNTGLSSWSVDNSGSIGTVSGSAWNTYNNGFSNRFGNYYSPDSSVFALVNGDTSGSSTTTASMLTSPVFSLAGYNSANLIFQHNYNYNPNDINAKIELSIDGGFTWTTVLADYKSAATSVGSINSYSSTSIDLSAYAGQSNVKIRFNHKSNWGSYWAIDNVIISGTPTIASPVWTPTTYLFSDASTTIPYISGISTDTVYAYPNGVTTNTTITYHATITNGSCQAIDSGVLTVFPTPSIITGPTGVCIGQNITLSDSLTGGTWSSSNPAIATINSSGVVNGIATGNTIITYTSSAGCFITTTVSVNPLPSFITGTNNVCAGLTTTLNDFTAGGTWSSTNTAIANINSSGVVTGNSGGIDTIQYTLSTGCSASFVLIVNPNPSAISGLNNICLGATTTLGETSTGGTWTSNNTAIASVSGTGVTTGAGLGTTTITYSLPTGCVTTFNVTINPLPASITGINTVCRGLTDTLTDLSSGGTWSVNNSTLASISSSGIVTGIMQGVDTIVYTLGTGCNTIYPITINSLPAVITGNNTLCNGSTTTLGDITLGGTWTNNNTVSNISSAGVVTGSTSGTTIVTYTLPTGCITTYQLTVNPLPSAITGTNNVCEGATSTLSESSTGGTWSISNTTNAIVTSTGVVLGVSAGLDTVKYTFGTGCQVNFPITINTTPASITGTVFLCQNATTTLGDLTGSGTWTSGNTSVATVSGTGIVSGVAAGNTNITYTLTGGCIAVKNITINPLPTNISGSGNVCEGTSVALNDVTTGGVWSASNSTIASISGSGIVSGIAPGLDTIYYTLGTGCLTAVTITVNPNPAPTTGTGSICVLGNLTLANSTIGGTWTSNNISLATISGSGFVSGLSAGVDTIVYSLPTGCIATTEVTINPLPTAITGLSNICVGTSATLTDATTGGTWSSFNSSIATISGTGVVTGILSGVDTIYYTLGTGCTMSYIITINPLPTGISGTTNVCVSTTTSLSDITSGGTWSSGDNSIAIISGSGIVTGVSAGNVTISYTLPTGCIATSIVTVNPLPATIAGVASVCAGQTITLSDISAGGTWASTNNTVALVSGSGVVSGIVSGIDTINYTLGTGCTVSSVITVNPIPAAITGTQSICIGGSTSFSDLSLGGTWSTTNNIVGTISGTGIFYGVSSGIDTVIYTLPTSCTISIAISVNPAPASITGINTVCEGSSIALNDTISGGTWTSSNTAIATISGTGVVSGIAAGIDTINYAFGTTCIMQYPITVNALPAIITGLPIMCANATITLSDATPSGVWSIYDTTIATISSTGVITGVTAGTTDVTYTLPTGCGATVTLSVNPLPATITGINSICQGTSTTLSDVSPFGSWSSQNNTVATISGLGIMIGISGGTDTITYSFETGCYTTYPITINPSPSVINGPANICFGSVASYSDLGAGGTWMSSDSTIIGITSSGVVNTNGVGIATITYTLPAGCFITKTITVNPTPSLITGVNSICQGKTSILNDTTLGGIWTSSDTAIAVISGAGTITGIATGIDTISYSLSTGCAVIFPITINPVPSVILGNPTICTGTSALYIDSTTLGTWSSSDTALLTISSTGLATGISTGAVAISYTLGSGCYTSFTLSVNTTPASITGTNSVCMGNTISLTDTSAGGSWSTNNTTIAIVSGTGVVTGILAGTDTAYYTMGSGCFASYPITVNQIPSIISGSTSICTNATNIYTDSVIGGTWSSSDTTIAAINASGNVWGIATGVVTIGYALPWGCSISTIVSVNPGPVHIAGVDSVCLGTGTTLTDSISGGIWTSSNSIKVTIDSLTGIVSGIDTGAVILYYTLSSGCSSSMSFTVNQLPAPIFGELSICVNDTTNLIDSVPDGIWSNVGSVISITPSGFVTGLSAGTTNITYTLPSGCSTTTLMTINPLADAGVINCADTLCIGSSIVLNDTASGGSGVWSVDNVLLASISSDTLTGLSAGWVTVSYTVANSCGISSATKMVYVNTSPIPGTISGSDSVCMGATISFTDTVYGGVWSLSNTNATVTDSFVTGVIQGIDTLKYTVGNACGFSIISKQIIINPSPDAGIITGVINMCEGGGTTLSDAISGGVWSISNSLAVISSGVVFAVSQGMDTVSYSVTNSCGTAIATTTVTIYALPVAGTITGTDSVVCAGSTITLSESATSGVWSCSNSSATVSGGNVTGVSFGADTISYTVSTVYCGNAIATKTITVFPAPYPGIITGANVVCIGSQIILTDTVSGGTWGITNSNATNLSDTITGVITGADTITYSVTNSCGTAIASKTVFVAPLPYAGTLMGLDSVCATTSIGLTDSISGGVWTASNTNATVSSGIVTGVNPGADTIKYSYTNSCGSDTTTKVVYVKAQPDAGTIVGADSICVGEHTTLLETSIYGYWTASNGKATISPIISGGFLTGITTGLDTIIYTVTNTCGTAITTMVLSVRTVPVTPIISGSSYVCIGGRLDTLWAIPNGGTWTVSNSNVMIFADTAIGVHPGLDTISYTLANGCGSKTVSDSILVYSSKQCDSIIHVSVSNVSATNNESLVVYPNPSNGEFTIELPFTNIECAIAIMDVYGKMVFEQKSVSSTHQSLPVSLSNVPSGNYFIRVVTMERTWVKKIEIK